MNFYKKLLYSIKNLDEALESKQGFKIISLLLKALPNEDIEQYFVLIKNSNTLNIKSKTTILAINRKHE